MLRRCLVVCLIVSAGGSLFAKELSFRVQEIDKSLGVGYAVRILDMNADRQPDILVVDTDRVIWYENPSWKQHTLIQGQTKKDNVCIAPYDIDGDGRVDFALGADWRPFDTVNSGSIEWLRRGASPEDRWSVHPIGTEPTVHRMQWVDLEGDGRSELVVVPLMGRGTTKPEFAEAPIRILAYSIPADPLKGPWTPRVLNQQLHVAHNFAPADVNRDGRTDLLVASFEGVSLLTRASNGEYTAVRIGEGNQNNERTPPNRGASEIKHGTLAGNADYIATIEPWHGFQVVVYTRPAEADNANAPSAAGKLWDRRVLDDQLQWGHAVWCIDLDGDADQELVIGVRDDYKQGDTVHACGVRIYDPKRVGQRLDWTPQRVDAGGVAIEDLAAADLDADGKADLVAVGRKTKNVRIYWNETPR